MQFAHFEKSGRRKRRPSFALLYLLLPLPGAPKRRIKEGAFHPDKRLIYNLSRLKLPVRFLLRLISGSLRLKQRAGALYLLAMSVPFAY